MSMVHVKQIKGTDAFAQKNGSNASGIWPISINSSILLTQILKNKNRLCRNYLYRVYFYD